jgi:uncharacterized protein
VRFVLDPNVLVSAVVADGVSRRLFDLWRRDRCYELIVCPMLLDELADVLRRDRFRRFIALAGIDLLLALLRTEASVVADPEDIERATADPDDDYLVALVLREDADALVSGDKDLTELEVADPPVLTPAEALTHLDEPGR